MRVPALASPAHDARQRSASTITESGDHPADAGGHARSEPLLPPHTRVVDRPRPLPGAFAADRVESSLSGSDHPLLDDPTQRSAEIDHVRDEGDAEGSEPERQERQHAVKSIHRRRYDSEHVRSDCLTRIANCFRSIIRMPLG